MRTLHCADDHNEWIPNEALVVVRLCCIIVTQVQQINSQTEPGLDPILHVTIYIEALIVLFEIVGC